MIVLQETSYSEQDYIHLFPIFIFFTIISDQF